MSTTAYPFADGRNLAWTLDGFGDDEWLASSVPLDREQYLRVRHLFALDEGDLWMAGGVYPVPREIWPAFRELLGTAVDFRDDQEYFLGACQDLPDGEFWRPDPADAPHPGPIPPP
ncbi:hypothetical protein [Streptomyces sp. NPDC002537]